MPTTSLPALQNAIIALMTSPSPTPADLTLKAQQLALAIDAHTQDVLLKATATGTSPSGAVTIPPGGIIAH
jgi:hypothetical protein